MCHRNAPLKTLPLPILPLCLQHPPISIYFLHFPYHKNLDWIPNQLHPSIAIISVDRVPANRLGPISFTANRQPRPTAAIIIQWVNPVVKSMRWISQVLPPFSTPAPQHLQLEGVGHHRLNQRLRRRGQLRKPRDPRIELQLQLTQHLDLGAVQGEGLLQTQPGHLFGVHGEWMKGSNESMKGSMSLRLNLDLRLRLRLIEDGTKMEHIWIHGRWGEKDWLFYCRCLLERQQKWWKLWWSMVFVFWSCFRVKVMEPLKKMINDDWLFSGDSGRVLVLWWIWNWWNNESMKLLDLEMFLENCDGTADIYSGAP